MATPINKERARELNKMLRETLDAFCALHGLALEPYKLRYSDSDIQCRLRFIQPNTVGAARQAQSKIDIKTARERDNYVLRARQFNLPQLGTKIRLKGRVFELTGLRIKKVCMTEVATGKLFKMDARAAALCERV